MSGCTRGREVYLLHEIGHKDLVLLQQHRFKRDLAHSQVQEWSYSVQLKHFIVVISVEYDLTSERHLLYFCVFCLKYEHATVEGLCSRELETDKDRVPLVVFLYASHQGHIEIVALPWQHADAQDTVEAPLWRSANRHKNREIDLSHFRCTIQFVVQYFDRNVSPYAGEHHLGTLAQESVV